MVTIKSIPFLNKYLVRDKFIAMIFISSETSSKVVRKNPSNIYGCLSCQQKCEDNRERERKREKEHVQQIFYNGTCSFDFDTILSFYGKNQSSNYLWYSTLYIIWYYCTFCFLGILHKNWSPYFCQLINTIVLYNHHPLIIANYTHIFNCKKYTYLRYSTKSIVCYIMSCIFSTENMLL